MVLMSGTAFAQMLTIIFAPILTRLFSPEEYGTLALFSAIIGVLTIIMTLRYEVAIVLPREDKDAANLVILSLGIVATITTLLFIAIYFFGDYIALIIGVPNIIAWLWFVPIGAFLLGIYNTLNYWLTRKMEYREIATSRVFQSIVMISTQISSGLLGAGTKGLIGGQLLGQFIASLFLGMRTWKDKDYILSVINKDVIKELIKKYKEFPIYNSSQSLINSLSSNFMLFAFSAIFGVAVVGFYAMALRIIQLPAGVISNSIKQVYFQTASQIYNSGGNIINQLIKCTFYLAIIGFIPMLLVVFYAPGLFEWALGSEWREAGCYASWLVIWLYFGFMNTPSLATIQIIGVQRYFLVYEVVLMATRVSAILLCSIYYNEMVAIIAYSIVGALFNLILIIGTVIIAKFKVHAMQI